MRKIRKIGKKSVFELLSPNSLGLNLSSVIENQVEDYALISNEWKPYVMRGSCSHAELTFVSTDENGSRTSYFRGSPVSYKDYRMSKGNYSVLLGNSVAYGVGASSDLNCIASQLSRLTEHPWYNLAGRAYNQTQEVLSLILFGAELHKNIVVFSGINNLIFSLAFNQFNDPVMPFWGQNEFNTLNDRKNIRNECETQYSRETKYNRMKFFLDRDLQILSSFVKSSSADKIHKSRLTYVFQPLLAWLDKDLHPSEKKAIDLWDKDTESLFKEVHKPYNILPFKERYIGDLKKICYKYEIDFFDMNSTEEFIQPEHLFLDRVHLTDIGQLKAAECIVNFLKL